MIYAIYSIFGFIAGFFEEGIYRIFFDKYFDEFEDLGSILGYCFLYGSLSIVFWPVVLPIKMAYHYRDKIIHTKLSKKMIEENKNVGLIDLNKKGE